MIGAILGDITGSPYEFDRGRKKLKSSLYSLANPPIRMIP